MCFTDHFTYGGPFYLKHKRLAINTANLEETLATDISVWGQHFLADYMTIMEPCFSSIITLKSVLCLIRG